MTPLYIEIGLHYYCRADEFPRLSAPAVREAVAHFVECGLLIPQHNEEKARRNYEPSDGLKVWIDALRAVPFPERQWIMSRERLTGDRLLSSEEAEAALAEVFG